MEPIHLQPEFPDEPVFHYTSQSGLLGILKSKSIWATNILYMNDAAEIQYAADMARQQIASLEQTASGDNVKLLQCIDEELSRITRMRVDGIYVCSFSKDGDQLSQWRGYCPNGMGFSIGINLVRLQKAMTEQGFRAAKCVYNFQQQLDMIKKFLSRSLDGLQKLTVSGADKLELEPIFIGLNFLQIAATIKHEKFAEESEWRLISQPIPARNDRLLFREGKSTVIPYVEFRLAKGNEPLHIEKLYIGPTPHKELAFMATYQLLFANGIDNPPIEISEVPFRTW